MIACKKLLIVSLAVVALGATTSCNKNDSGVVGGLPYTLVETNTWLGDGQQLTLGFSYTGSNMKVYWSDDIENPSTESFHTFTGSDEPYYPYFIVEGDITSISFTYEDGQPIAPDNDQIKILVLSNTITSLPKKACASLFYLRTVYIPNSVKQIGEYAFMPGDYASTVFFCEAETRPNTWSPNWRHSPIFDNTVNWGFSYYMDEEGQTYILYNKGGHRLANYLGFAFPTTIRKLVIPKTIKVNNYEFDVCTILSLGYASDTVEKMEIHNSVEYVGFRAFSHSEKLKTVEFVGDFDFLFFDNYIFSYCESLTSVTLPKGLVNFSYGLFEYCHQLTNVNIPGTVQYFDENVFRSACLDKTLNLDLTGYKTAKSVPYINAEEAFHRCYADAITFTYAKSVGDNTAFTDKGWPKRTINDIAVTWQVTED